MYFLIGHVINAKNTHAELRRFALDSDHLDKFVTHGREACGMSVYLLL